jgi:hypothetical protein
VCVCVCMEDKGRGAVQVSSQSKGISRGRGRDLHMVAGNAAAGTRGRSWPTEPCPPQLLQYMGRWWWWWCVICVWVCVGVYVWGRAGGMGL